MSDLLENHIIGFLITQLNCVSYIFRFFPIFDLVKVVESNTAVLKRLTQNEGLYQAFQQKYEHVFEDYVEQRAYRELYQS